MIPSATIEIRRAEHPIKDPVTKFGGEPCWLEAPQWPLSRQQGIPMAFLGQIALSDVPSLPEELRASGRVAYFFMTDTDEAVVHTCLPEGGENAVVIQPGGAPPADSTTAQPTNRHDEYPECAVRLTPHDEPETVDPQSGLPGVAGSRNASTETGGAVSAASKLGGVPCFIQGVEYPPGDTRWHLVLQLNTNNPIEGGEFSPNFEDGRAHVFVSEDGHTGRLLWQYQP